MSDATRRDNMLGAFVLAVADRIRAETDAAVGHSGAAAAALVTIAHYPGRTVEDLRQTIGLSQSATVRVVDRLVDQRLVKRQSAGRGPAVSLTPTAAGRRQARAILDIRSRVIQDVVPDLSQSDAKALERILDRALEQLANSPRTTICRLCEPATCRTRNCPVVRAQRALGEEPPDFTPL